MADTITLSQSTYNDLLGRVSRLENLFTSLLKKLEQEPPTGTKEWWTWSNKKGMEDIKTGRCTTVRNQKELKEFFAVL